MEQAQTSNTAPPDGEMNPTMLGESSPGRSSGKKRPASDIDLQVDVECAGSRTEPADDARLPSTKRLKGDEASSAPASPEEGEMSDSKASESEAPQTAQSKNTVEAPQKAHGGWNRGISGSLRTSFGAPSKDRARKSTQLMSQPAPEFPVQPPAESVESSNLVLPQGEPNFAKVRRRSIWKSRFQNWCLRVMALNDSHEGVKDPALLRYSWERWLEARESVSPDRRVDAVKAAAETNLNPQSLQEMASRAMEIDPLAPWGDSPKESGQAQSPGPDQQSLANTPTESPKAASNGSQEGNDWTIPPTQSPDQMGVGQKDVRGWEEKFKAWCISLHQLNDGRIRVATPRERNRVTESYLRWIGSIDGLSKSKATAARRTAVRYAQENSAILAAIFAAKLAPAPAPVRVSVPTQPQGMMKEPASTPQDQTAITEQDMDTVSDAPDNASMDLPDSEDLDYRERYFPGIGPNKMFCHMCASHGHEATECPEMACRFCRDPSHRSFSCPTRQRCTKCKQLGHSKRECREKLAVPVEERECAFCGSRDHDDASCHELWRSFLFNPDTARKVRSLPVYCYTCGRQGHYGPACGLNPDKPRQGLWETWSQANCDRYIDPASSEVAIIYATQTASSAPASDRPDLAKSIIPRRHVFFEEEDDDDEDDEFIRPPVQKSARSGLISFSGNRGGGRGTGGGSQDGRRPSRQSTNNSNGRPGYAHQPPLPPGPPPPLPPQNYQESRRHSGRRRGGGGGRH
ncbi:hypothetical protein VTI74DRAFT_5868 [Chaetomium olivicolor]